MKYVAKGPHKRGCCLCGFRVMLGDAMVRWMFVSEDGPSGSNICRAHETCNEIYLREQIEDFTWGEAFVNAWGDDLDCVKEAAEKLAEARGFPAEMDDVQRVLWEWGQRTFPGATEAGILAHLKQEAAEELQVGCSVDEYADVVMLAFQCCSARGESLADAIAAKHAINLKRKWGPRNADGYFEHVREKAES